jgi:hypothetical protein
MQRYANETMIRRNAQMGKVMLIGGLGLLVLGVVVSVFRPNDQALVIAMAMGGMFTSQFGMAFTTRWGRRPRLDEVLDDAFKGMDGRTSLFHYCLGTHHALVAPNGVFAILPRADQGTVRYADGKWSVDQKKGGFLRRAGARPIKTLERDAQLEVDLLVDSLHKHLPDAKDVKPGVFVVFANPNVTVQAESAPLPAFHIKKVKEGVRRLERRPTLTPEQVTALAQKLRLL